MTVIAQQQIGARHLLMGNEAITRGALEAGVSVAAGYPGTPSSEIITELAKVAKKRNLYVEWSVNEKVALEVAAAGSFAELRSMCVMKQVGVNVAADFLLHLALYGTRGGMVLVMCEDPGGLSSSNEGDARHYAKMMEFPLIEPGDFQEAKDMTRWAFELSEEIRNVVMVRSVTRLSHASGNVVFGDLPADTASARFNYEGSFLEQMEGPVITVPVLLEFLHQRQQGKLKKAAEIFETSPFNTYNGPDAPELLVITSSAGNLYSREAIQMLGANDRVGVLKLGTTWPLPSGLLEKYLSRTNKVLVVEEGLSFMEDNLRSLAMGLAGRIGVKTFHGKIDGSLPTIGELNPDIVASSLAKILGCELVTRQADYVSKVNDTIPFGGIPERDMAFCPGCPHRASFWSINNAMAMDNRKGFVCGDIGCYTLGLGPSGFFTLKTNHSMGSGAGVAGGFAKLTQFGMNQPVVAVCGDGTFFHSVIPALVNAVHNQSPITLVVLDNSGTAMTGFQTHPGLPMNVRKEAAPAVDIPAVCEAIGARVKICDPFDIDDTRETLLSLLKATDGVNVLVLRQVCALSPEKKGKKQYEVSVDESRCLGETCGCNRLCTRVFKCPGLIWDPVDQKAHIDEVLCSGCGVCASVCPSGAIQTKEAQ
ncbi:MAG: 4Fe-4S binding protein [Deltaproteobacteria bacterium]|nr:4Fe-4S binding protein [Deltaproteobacteria bacterium]